MRTNPVTRTARAYLAASSKDRDSVRRIARRIKVSKSTLYERISSPTKKIGDHKQYTPVWHADLLKCIDYYKQQREFPLELRNLRQKAKLRGRITTRLFLFRLAQMYQADGSPPLPNERTIQRFTREYTAKHGKPPHVPRLRSMWTVIEDRKALAAAKSKKK
jgi:hypothetical protein